MDKKKFFTVVGIGLVVVASIFLNSKVRQETKQFFEKLIKKDS